MYIFGKPAGIRSRHETDEHFVTPVATLVTETPSQGLTARAGFRSRWGSRLAAIISLWLAALFVGILHAPGALAATLTWTFDCGAGGSTTTLTVSPGDVIDLTPVLNPVTCNAVTVNPALATGSGVPLVRGSLLDTFYTVNAGQPAGFYASAIDAEATGTHFFLDLVYVTASASTSSAGTESVPEPLLQQVGIPAQGCGDVDDSALAYGTGLTGGWAPSWSRWINGGTGGPVCSRTLVFIRQQWQIDPG